jgi:crotonobetainyl-CoA:carnitine CoA-transferase CaiB-like acyl-CoA transferase
VTLCVFRIVQEAMQNAFKHAGRHVTVGAFEPHFWATLCRHFGREDFLEPVFGPAVPVGDKAVEVVTRMVELTEAETTTENNFVPPDILGAMTAQPGE